MSELTLVKRDKKSPYWIVRGTFEGRRVEISTGTTVKAEARRKLDEIERGLRAGSNAAGRLTFARALALYREHHPNARFLKPIEDYFGTMPAADITNAIMRKAAQAIYPNASDATVRRQLYTPVKAILNAAAEDDLISAPRLKAPAGGGKRTVFMLPAQADALLTELARDQNAMIAVMVTMLIGQGIRMGEAVTLKGSDVSLDHRFAILRDTKNGEERRVTLIPRVVAALSTLPTLGQAGPLFRRFDGYGFRSGKNSGGQIAKNFSRATVAAGLDPARFTPHVCRHTWATWFYAQTKDVRRLQDEGGWKSGEWQRYTKIGTPDLGQSALKAGWNFADRGSFRGSDDAHPEGSMAYVV